MHLTTEQVARRLGVKPQTVYAYVSRGMLHSVRDPAGGKGSVFDEAEVERLARSSRKDRAPAIRTSVSVVRDGRLFYRGHDAADLAHTNGFEDVVGLLLTGRLQAPRFDAPIRTVAIARAANEQLPPSTRLADRLRIITAVAAATDPLRFNTNPEAVTTTAATLLATLIEALPLEGDEAPADATLAARLWTRLTRQPATEAGIAALNAALVLLADHGLATSTLAARVAASSRADPYAVVTAGLSAFDGPLHGAAATQAYRLIADVLSTGDAVGTFAERLRLTGRVEGFWEGTHSRYPGGDIRAVALLQFLNAYPVPNKLRKASDGLMRTASDRSPRRPNVEFALAMLVHATRMRPDAGEAVFAIARTAGWIAHALEEYEEPGLRFRIEGSYVGDPTT